jgi:TPR repeat protein
VHVIRRVVSETGPWARHLSAGLSAFLDGDERRALASYARSAELGYPPAKYNAAWLLEKRSRQLGSTRNEARLAAAVYHEKLVEGGGGDGEGVRGLRADLQAWAHVRLGDCAYYEGGCGGRAASAAEHYRAAGELGSGQVGLFCAQPSLF